jgi:ribosomal protein L12E/L44/L45/RPP1/RPP2
VTSLNISAAVALTQEYATKEAGLKDKKEEQEEEEDDDEERKGKKSPDLTRPSEQ